jgi:hypothetical protein
MKFNFFSRDNAWWDWIKQFDFGSCRGSACQITDLLKNRNSQVGSLMGVA